MILSDREIIAALKRQFVRITPEPDLCWVSHPKTSWKPAR